MNEQLKVVENIKNPEINTENQVIQQEYTIDGYDVAIFYTNKQSGQERYINAVLADLDTNECTYLGPIRMLEPYEIERDEDEKSYEANIDVEDLNNINQAIADFLEFKRLEPIRRQYLARQALRQENDSHLLVRAA